MEKTDKEILEANGWSIDCESPFEIRHEETNSFATGYAAQIVLDKYKEIELDNEGELRPLNIYLTEELNDNEEFAGILPIQSEYGDTVFVGKVNIWGNNSKINGQRLVNIGAKKY